MSGAALLPAFDDPVHDSQRVFRAVLQAVAQPGRAVNLPACPPGPRPLEPGAAAIALALLDLDTPVWVQDDEGAVADYLRFHCGCPLTGDPAQARFAVITDPVNMPELACFAAGSPEYPDLSATLVVQVNGFTGARPVRLTGPGIREEATLALCGVRPGFWREMQGNHALFPCGVDLLFVNAHQLVALPRSVRAEAE